MAHPPLSPQTHVPCASIWVESYNMWPFISLHISFRTVIPRGAMCFHTFPILSHHVEMLLFVKPIHWLTCLGHFYHLANMKILLRMCVCKCLRGCTFHFSLSFFKDFMYLFMRDTEREAETQAEGEAGSLRGARCRTRSPGVTAWAQGRRSNAEPPRCL